mmetsp:Transcript_9383/g.23409  ORF Transcript_9383/g.23409 Transcript_9383/m.23409 type:complete len:82 (-) Transcript_9383:143-388(-)
MQGHSGEPPLPAADAEALNSRMERKSQLWPRLAGAGMAMALMPLWTRSSQQGARGGGAAQQKSTDSRHPDREALRQGAGSG